MNPAVYTTEARTIETPRIVAMRTALEPGFAGGGCVVADELAVGDAIGAVSFRGTLAAALLGGANAEGSEGSALVADGGGAGAGGPP
jgi:hypothetical protein